MEITTPLTIHPYVFHSQVCHTSPAEEVFNTIDSVISELKAVNGTLRAVFKNRDFSEYANSSYFYSLLRQIHEIK